MFAPESVNVPLPAFVSVNAPPTAPPNVNEPSSTATLEFAVKVTAPLKVFAPEILRSTPPLAMPVPATLNGSAEVMPPMISSASPEPTTVPAVAAPKAALFAMRIAPTLTVVNPV